MTEDERKEIKANLIAFVIRVSKGEGASPAEIAALPEIVKLLINAFFIK